MFGISGKMLKMTATGLHPQDGGLLIHINCEYVLIH